jgi:3-dehydroquinate dehydratase/shikimate dehydrogenase
MKGGRIPLKDREINARVVMDMVYSPAETRFLRVARARGLQVIPGWEMLLHQAARQFEIWTGKPAPLDEMQRILLAALEQQTAAAGKKKK